jgi:hypothetical protein
MRSLTPPGSPQSVPSGGRGGSGYVPNVPGPGGEELPASMGYDDQGNTKESSASPLGWLAGRNMVARWDSARSSF